MKLNSLVYLLPIFIGNLSLAQSELNGNVTSPSGKKLSDVEISVDGGLGFGTSDNDGKFLILLSKTQKGSTIRLRAKKVFFQQWDRMITVGDLPIDITLIPENIDRKETKVSLTFDCNTDAIENQEFIFSNTPWPFITNKDGEDIKSKFTPLLIREQIHPLQPLKENSRIPSIANNRLLLKLIARQNISDALYIEKIYIQVLDKYKINKETMFNNVWLPKISPNKYSIKINGIKTIYDIDMGEDLIKINKQEPEFFNIKIEGDESCNDFIYSFKIIFEYINEKGIKNTKESDRTYKIAFYKSDTYKTENIDGRIKSKIEKKESEKKTDTLVVGIDSIENGPGIVFPNKEMEKKCFDIINDLKTRSSKIENYFDEVIQIGPILWSYLKEYNVDTIGFRAQFIDSKNKSSMGEGRVILNVETPKLYSNAYFKYLLSKFSKGRPRPANDKERTFFYSIIGFEIIGKPVTIIETDNIRLLMYIEDEKINYLEVLYPEDALDFEYFIYHSINLMKEDDSVLLRKIFSLALSEEINRLIDLTKNNEELTDSLFCVDIMDMSTDNSFIGLDRLVEDNPGNTLLLFYKMSEYNKINMIESGSIVWELLCKIAINFRNFHSSNLLLEKLLSFSTYENGGEYVLNDCIINHENKHGEQGKVNLSSTKIRIGNSPFDNACNEAIQALNSLKMNTTESVIEKLNLIVPKILRRFNLRTSFIGDALNDPYVYRNETKFLSGGKLETILLTYSLLLNGSNEQNRINAKSILSFCNNLDMHYSDLLFYNLYDLDSNFSNVLAVLSSINFKDDTLCFDDIINKISGCSFGYINDMYYKYKSYWVNHDSLHAINIGDSILFRLNNCKPIVLSLEWLEKVILTYKSAYLSYTGDKTQAILSFNKIPFFVTEEEKKLFYDSAINDPTSILSIRLFFLINDELNKYFKGFKNGKLFDLN